MDTNGFTTMKRWDQLDIGCVKKTVKLSMIGIQQKGYNMDRKCGKARVTTARLPHHAQLGKYPPGSATLKYKTWTVPNCATGWGFTE